MSSGFVPSDCFSTERKKDTVPLFVVSTDDFEGWRDSAPASIKQWLLVAKFSAKPGASCLLPAEAGLAGVVVTVDDPSCLWQFANLPSVLPIGSFEAEPELSAEVATALSLGWALGCYRFERYKKKPTERAMLVWPELADKASVLALAEGISLARDLVNTPASDLGPEELADAAKKLALSHGAKYSVIVGDALLTKNYPMIHAVGRASTRAPRLVDFRWGKATDPLVALVGKGVCFDTGGLDLKPAAYMKLMKKDMGGAALVLGLAHVIMSLTLPIRLRVLIPSVENSVSGNAMRPLDVLTSRKGLTVEVVDTDAEGRLILADALTEADSENPELIIDAATLTGAARVALGAAMPAVFATKDETWKLIETACDECADPVWRMPLHESYRSKLSSKVADIANLSPDPYGGAISAALFLSEFISKDRDWVHVDTMGYNLDPRAGRPVGGEALGLLTLDAMLRARFGKNDASQTSSAAAPNRSPRSGGPKKASVKGSTAQQKASKKVRTSVAPLEAKTKRAKPGRKKA